MHRKLPLWVDESSQREIYSLFRLLRFVKGQRPEKVPRINLVEIALFHQVGLFYFPPLT